MAKNEKRGYWCENILNRLTTKYDARDISHDSFIESRLLTITLQTGQAVRGYGLGKPLTRLVDYIWFENTVRSRATLRTDLHGFLDVFKRTIDS